ncbi:nitroreductase [Streptomyces sp. NPDC048057]|uniref:nitroreductase n=1 Tax=Streptomyces sp. NPDC048057 TaxID=3155628 RepID=UPI0033DD1E74
MTTMPTPLAAALLRARSHEAPGPDLPHRPATVPAPRGLPVPLALDPLLRHSLAGGRRRPVPSAGALHPVRVRLLAGSGSGVPPGQYAYDPRTHHLHPLGPAPRPAPPGAFAVVGVAPEATVAHYRHRAWPLTLLDAGHAVAALVAAGASAYCLDLAADGLPAAPTGTGGGILGETAGAVPLAVVRLTRTGVLSSWPNRAAAGQAGAARHPADGHHPDLAQARDALTLVAAAGSRHGTWRTAPPRAPLSVVLRRRSAPLTTLAAARRPDDDALGHVLAAARAAATGGPRWYVAVGGDRPGLLTARTRGAAGLRTVATGPVLPTLAAWAAGQGWLARTGAVLLAVGCPTGAPPARVRRDHLLAGYGVGHAHLAATALGLSARPVGSWQCADLGAAIGGTAGDGWVLHALALGAPPRRRSPAPVPDVSRRDGPAVPGPRTAEEHHAA